ncbi:MAG: caspase family protein, partial [Ktedonobacteraceae bacterium]
MRQNDYAVVVGIAHYPLFHSDLGGPINDAQHYAEWLVTAEDQGGAGVPGEHVTTILVPVPIPDPNHPEAANGQVPLQVVEKILAAFENLRETVQNLHREGGAEERLYIFLAGHGFSIDTEQLGIEEPVLLMSNAEQGFWPHFAGHYCAEWFVKSSLFQEVVLFMDCCRNEPLINFPLSLPPWGTSTSKTRARKFYGFATKWAQKSREQKIDGMMQGVFTWSLLKALGGDITDNEGRVTEKELKGSIYNSVRKVLANGLAPANGEFQEPDFDGDDGWVFAQIASKQTPTATVQIDLGQLSPETVVELIDASHNTIEKHMPQDRPWQTHLSPGFYLLQVSTSGQRKFFDVTGSDPLTISLEEKVVQENHDDATGKVHLVADAGDPTTEVFVIDSHFQRVTEGVTGGHGRLEVDLDPGIYKVKFVAGFLAQEEYVALQAGSGPVIVPAPPLYFSASAPIKETRTTQDYHENKANQVSKQIHCEIGIGSQLFVFVRDLAKQGCNDCATGLTLHDLAGNLLVDFTQVGERDVHNPETDHWVGCTVQLDPGAYRLRVQTPIVDACANAEILEQIVVTSGGWQTQVFLLRRLFGSQDDCQTLRANLNEASMLMVPVGTGFQPERSGFREAELARQGLIRGRTVFEASELSRMAWRDHKNPMLGIYGAHQLLLSEKLEPPDLDLLRNVTSTLQNMIGTHPDVIALDAFLDDLSTNVPVYQAPGYRTVYQAPPMLRSSWNILVRASIAHPEIIRGGSLASYVADRIWGDGTWLVWQGSSTDTSIPQLVEPLDVSTLRFVYPQVVTILDALGNKPIVDFVKENNLSNLERFLLEYIALSRLSMVAGQVPDEEQAQAWVRENLTTAKLVQALHMPSVAISEATASLVK